MARVVIKTAQEPYHLKPEPGKDYWICMCGLSKNQPFCDSSHKKTKTENPDELYQYDDQGNRLPIEADEDSGYCGGCADKSGGCCGEKDSCCGGHDHLDDDRTD